MYLSVFELASADDLASLDWFNRLRQSAWAVGEEAQAVTQIIQDVQAHGDKAVVRYMRQWTDPEFSQEDICVPPGRITEALVGLEPKLLEAFKTAIDHVSTYQKHIKPVDCEPVTVGDATLGLRFTPMQSVGLMVPGGKAAYPSTVIMLAVPAMVAGISPKAISVATPPPTRSGKDTDAGRVSPLVLAVCALLGIERVYRIGGAQAAAALAVGTHLVKPVDMIVGPGNVYTQLAKLQLNGRVGIDGFYGPSEILTVADESANPAFVAADLIAQAEHDPGRCYLVAWSRKVVGQVNEQIEIQLEYRKRRRPIVDALKNGSAALLVKDQAAAGQVANQIAAEHVNLAVQDPDRWLASMNHGGQYFLGDRSPVAAGDYIAGPSHCLPTGTTARFASGVSVYTFLKRSGTVSYDQGMTGSTLDAMTRLANAEGLEGHAASAQVRAT